MNLICIPGFRKEENGEITSISLEITDKDKIRNEDELKQAVRNACHDFAGTKPGQELYENQGYGLTWDDFIKHVPNEMCHRHGFLKKSRCYHNICVDRREILT